MLRSTKFIDYHLADAPDPFYIQDFNFKLSYLNSISISNHSEHELCGAVFLTYFTTPIWVAIDCHYQLPHNYFLCERHMNFSHHQHTLQLLVCPRQYTYINAQCWSITAKHLSRHIATDPPAPPLLTFLTSWSLGHDSRSMISLRPTKKFSPCLMSIDFPNQRLKEWVTTTRCDSSNLLLQRDPIMYGQVCQGRVDFTN